MLLTEGFPRSTRSHRAEECVFLFQVRELMTNSLKVDTQFSGMSQANVLHSSSFFIDIKPISRNSKVSFVGNATVLYSFSRKKMPRAIRRSII
jgi:hypothetical protein